MSMSRLAVALFTGLIALPACAEPAVVQLDAAEVYCTDAWSGGISTGVTYRTTMADHFAGEFRFCRVDMAPLNGPVGNAAAGWLFDPATRQTMVWCQATGANQKNASVRVRFALYGIAGTPDARCTTDREGHLP